MVEHSASLHHTSAAAAHHSMRWHLLYGDVFHSRNFYDEHHFINLYFIRKYVFVSSLSFNFAGCCIELFILFRANNTCILLVRNECVSRGREHKMKTYALAHCTYNFFYVPYIYFCSFFWSFLHFVVFFSITITTTIFIHNKSSLSEHYCCLLFKIDFYNINLLFSLSLSAR